MSRRPLFPISESMRIADRILVTFQTTGELTFPTNVDASISGSCIGLPTGLHGRQIVRFADGSELLLVHQGGPVEVSLSKAYQLRTSAERRVGVVPPSDVGRTAELYPEHAVVLLKEDLAFGGTVIKARTPGAIVSVHAEHAAYTVEFVVDGVSLLPDLIHPDLELAGQ